MKVDIEKMVKQYGLQYCVECGKCGAVCPMSELYPEYSHEISPRGVIEKALLGGDLLSSRAIWFCLTCRSCGDLCPAGVRFADFLQALRDAIVASGKKRQGIFCSCCGHYMLPKTVAKMLQERLPKEMHWLLAVCPVCRRYHQGARVKALLPMRKKVAR